MTTYEFFQVFLNSVQKSDVRWYLYVIFSNNRRGHHLLLYVDGVDDVAADDDVYRFFEGNIRILRKISPQDIRGMVFILKCHMKQDSFIFANIPGRFWPPSLKWCINDFLNVFLPEVSKSGVKKTSTPFSVTI